MAAALILLAPYIFFGVLMLGFAAWATVIVLPLVILYTALISKDKKEEMRKSMKTFRYLWCLGPYHGVRPMVLGCFGCTGSWPRLPSFFEAVSDPDEHKGDPRADWGWGKIGFLGGIGGGNPGGHPPRQGNVPSESESTQTV
jgi:hypothetical protein